MTKFELAMVSIVMTIIITASVLAIWSEINGATTRPAGGEIKNDTLYLCPGDYHYVVMPRGVEPAVIP